MTSVVPQPAWNSKELDTLKDNWPGHGVYQGLISHYKSVT